VKVPNTEPGGWYFEFNNEFYPDTDDTAQVLLALSKVDNPRERYQHQVAQRAIEWEFAMQCRNGGWGSFDKDNTKMIFQYIPFADHNAMLDPPTVDITGRMLEMLAVYGYTRRQARREGHQVHLQRAGAGRKLVWPLGRELHLRHVPGAARARGHRRRSSRAADSAGGGVDSHGAEPDGGWGETCGSYDDPDTRGSGRARLRRRRGRCWGCWPPATTAPTRRQGRALAAERQRADGSWDESMGEGPTRQAITRERASPRFLSGLHHVSPVLPAAGFDQLQAGHGNAQLSL
jgi:squalene-hopene/tetraprenyl-beta-curcumene cyclase